MVDINLNNYKKFQRAVNYLTVAQIFLQDNFLLERPLQASDIKPRLLGHWGSCPGVSLIYAHLNRLIKDYGQEMMFILGPGHAFPALQASLFLEGSLQEFYPKATLDIEGIAYICHNFSWPHGFPSHSNPGTPGVILEGGELGYSLSTAYGAVLDNPNMIVACLMGDGEAETGPAAASWHLNKLVDPKTNGTVLPILHLNGYKISGPTVFGRMSDDELKALFWGYGYEPKIVDGDDLDQKTAEALDWAHHLIWDIKHSEAKPSPRLPMIILRTPKGMTGPTELDGQKITGNCLSHQVVLTEAKTNKTQLKMLEDWLKSYHFEELFDKKTGFGDFLKEIIPEGVSRMGMSPHAHGGKPVYQALNLPKIEDFCEDATKPGTIGSSSMVRAGLYLKEVFHLNQANHNFRLMSPDETYSNKLHAVFEETARGWVWPIKDWDKDLTRTGRVMEMLSEQTLQGLIQGYILTGRHGIFASYEAFIQIVASMMDQYAKFIKHTADYPWRKDFPSLNYILTSSGWRQDHNGFSHQNPGFIDGVLQRHGDFVDVYLPPDGNSTLVVLEKMLSSVRKINVLSAGKTLEPRWLTPELARDQIESGVMIWDFASDPEPDVVLTAAGDYSTKETLAAINLAKSEWPSARFRFINISSLTSKGLGTSEQPMSRLEFNRLFTQDKAVICNFHGYPETLKSILFDYIKDASRFDVRGYVECGSTTTPFDMHVRNRTSRYHLVIAIFDRLAKANVLPRNIAQNIILKYQTKISLNTGYIMKHGVDMPEIDEWQWSGSVPEDKALLHSIALDVSDMK